MEIVSVHAPHFIFRKRMAEGLVDINDIIYVCYASQRVRINSGEGFTLNKKKEQENPGYEDNIIK